MYSIYWTSAARDIVNPGREERDSVSLGISRELMGSSVSNRALGSSMAEPPQEAGQTDLCLPAIDVGVQADP